MSVGALTERYRDLKLVIKEQQECLKTLETKKRDMEEEMMVTMDNMGSSLVRTQFGTVSITNETVAQVTDWPVFYEYVTEKNAFYLLQRRVSSVAWRDECDSQGQVPGTEPFTKRKISFTNKTT